MAAPALAGSLSLVLLLATLGEGGATPDGTLAVHAVLAVLAIVVIALPRSFASRSIEPAVPITFALFVAWIVAGAATAPYAFAAWLVFLEIASFAAAAWLAARCGLDGIRFVAPCLAVGAALHGTAALVQWSMGNARPATTFLNPNHLAGWLVAALLVVAGWALARGGPAARIGLLVAAPALGGIVVTGSRGATIGLLVGAGTLATLRWREASTRVRRLLVVAGATGALAAGAAAAVRVSDADPFHWQRVRIWRAAIGVATEHPLFGAGAGQFAAKAANMNFPVEEVRFRFGRGFRTPHSDLLRLPCEFGWPGAGLALAAVGVATIGVATARRRGELFEGAEGPSAALAALGAQALFDDLTVRPALVVLVGVLGGLLLSRRRKSPIEAPAIARAATIVVLVAGFAVGEIAPWLAWDAAASLPRGRLEPDGLLRLDRALTWNPLQPDYWTRRAEHIVGDGTAWDLEAYAEAREAVERAVRLQPADAIYRRAAAWVEGMACRTLFRDRRSRERAAARYAEAARLSRHDATIPLDEASFLLGTGDPVGARRAAEAALRIEPRAVAPRIILAEAFLDAAGPDAEARARRSLDEAVALADEAEAPPTSPYEIRLARLDGERVAALRSRIASVGPREIGGGTDRVPEAQE